MGLLPDVLRRTSAVRNLVFELRRQVTHVLRTVRDRTSGLRRRIVERRNAESGGADNFPSQVTIEQPILPTEFVAAKIHNIELARRQIQNLPIPPNAVFSFWHLVGRPTPANGFQMGRSLLGGELRADYGGGLCQLSGIIYHASLVAGLRIRERHPHSRDIYHDSTRYTPLGADATVAYGFKDLRVENSLSVPICYRVMLSENRVACSVCATRPITPCQVEFASISQPASAGVIETRRQRPGETRFEVLSVSRYQKQDRS
ncbi:MAG: vancomycin resistance protein [Verrucomicrobia bacterium]|nr:MAG: vancomycin resistance protein [Verrucomicrobiota bacterium]